MSQCVVIITALDIEYNAVRKHLTGMREVNHPNGNIYERGEFSVHGRRCEIGIVQVRKGDIRAAVQTERAISYFKPNVVLFVGIAGGLKDVSLGDVVVAEKVYYYESGRDADIFHTRPEVGKPSFGMIERAQAEARKNDWLQRLLQVQETNPHVFIGPIAAGEKIVASTKSATFGLLKSHYSDALAVEMEGYGFLEAVHTNRDIDALIIRGISDLINDKEETDKEGWQEIAAQHASAFAFEILAKVMEDKESQQYDEAIYNDKSFQHSTKQTRKLSFDISNPSLWYVSDERYTATGSEDTFAWSEKVIDGDVTIYVDIESNHENGEGVIIVYGDGIKWSHGCLIFNITSNSQSIRAHTVYEGVQHLIETKKHIELTNHIVIMKIEIIGDKAALYVDGEKIASTFLPHDIRKIGRVGLHKYRERPAVIFSNIVIEEKK